MGKNCSGIFEREYTIRIERTKIESRLVNILTCYSKKSNLTNCQEKKAKLDDSFAQKRSKISETLRVLWIYSVFLFLLLCFESNRPVSHVKRDITYPWLPYSWPCFIHLKTLLTIHFVRFSVVVKVIIENSVLTSNRRV